MRLLAVSWIQTSVVLGLGRGADAVGFKDVESSDWWLDLGVGLMGSWLAGLITWGWNGDVERP